MGLTKAAQIASIVGALTAVTALYIHWPGPAQEAAPTPSAMSSQLAEIDRLLISQNKNSDTLKAESRFEADPEAKSKIDALMSIAITMYSLRERDEAYTQIIGYSLKNDLPEDALRIAIKMYSLTGRDEQYILVARHYIGKKDYKSAQEISGKMYSLTSRDELKKKILRNMAQAK